MNNFKEFQFARLVFMFAVPAQIFLAYMYATHSHVHSMSLISFVIANVLFVGNYLLFYGMRTTINDESIRVSYGIGVIHKTIKLADVKNVSIVSNSWYYGWGIRFIPNGMLYNIEGFSAVELTFKDKSRVIRIGTADAESLCSEILRLIK